MYRFLSLILAAVLFAAPALAADNYQVTQGSGTTMKSKDVGGGVEEVQSAPSDSSGNVCTATNGGSVAGCNILTGVEASGLSKPLIACDKHKFVNLSSATDTVLVQGVTSQVVYICGFAYHASGTNAVYLENTASTNNNCSSTLTPITATASLVAADGLVVSSAFWNGLSNTTGNGLCINSNSTGAVGVDLYYTQF